MNMGLRRLRAGLHAAEPGRHLTGDRDERPRARPYAPPRRALVLHLHTTAPWHHLAPSDARGDSDDCRLPARRAVAAAGEEALTRSAGSRPSRARARRGAWAVRYDGPFLPARPESRCPTCGGAGYKGRLGIYELFMVDADMADLVAEKKLHPPDPRRRPEPGHEDAPRRRRPQGPPRDHFVEEILRTGPTGSCGGLVTPCESSHPTSRTRSSRSPTPLEEPGGDPGSVVLEGEGKVRRLKNGRIEIHLPDTDNLGRSLGQPSRTLRTLE